MLSTLLGDVLWTLTGRTLIEVTSLRQSSCSLLYATTLGLWDISVVSAAAGVRAILGCAAWKLVGDALVDSGFVGCGDRLVCIYVYELGGGEGECT